MPRPACPVICCPRNLRPHALKRLHTALPADQQPVFAQIISGFNPSDEAPWNGLLVALAGDELRLNASAPGAIDAVVWVQLAPGNTAVVWSPPAGSEAEKAALRSAAEFIDARQIPLAQMVVGEHEGYDDAIQARCGFPRFAQLAYLFAEVACTAAESPRDDVRRAEIQAEQLPVAECEGLHFVPRAGEDPQRLAAILEQTYIDTLDCPELEGVRPMHEVLEGYRAQGRYAPGDWYYVEENGRDVGALLLTEHPGYGNWELVYMGVVPDARGRKCGERIIRFALEAAARGGAQRLVLAVDEANVPALCAYSRAGFVIWDRRIVYGRLRPRT